MPEITPSRYMVMAGWDDVPHLDEKTKAGLIASYKPHELDARTKGIPSLGAGAIYPIEEDAFVVAPFQIPDFWPRFYAMDVGWKKTAVLWFAWDRSIDCLYIYTEHYRGQAEPSIHAAAIKARGEWVKGVVDPAARGRSQGDGNQLIQNYKDLGLKLTPANNSVEAGIDLVMERLSTGRLKIFSTVRNLLIEMRIYRRDENGKIVKENDHGCDAMRYGVVSGTAVAQTKPFEERITVPVEIGDSSVGY